uniref:uncharacterized protein LOC120813928 n=1 Tax=Gasterosteus aculeatus aculeatus TaxID=481459 RepID=UPI001A987696|nr:uncharacterized protein LOC120813928 [Gasterosteus aculeatus aculeatus]
MWLRGKHTFGCVNHTSLICCQRVYNARPSLGFLQRLPSFFAQSSMESRKEWSLAMLREELSKRPLLSNVAFGLILMGLEKLVEVEFECPCNPLWNGVFSLAFFIIPAVMAFALMLIIQRTRFDAWSKKNISSFVPPIVWLMLLFFDGQYFACAMTGWNGRFVSVDKDAKMKWCKPNITSGELMLTIQKFYSISHGTGVVLLIFVCLIAYVIKGSCNQGVENHPGENLPLEA